MKVLAFRRKLARLCFLVLCILCIYVVYMVYLFSSQNTDILTDFSSRNSFKQYGPHDLLSEKHLQQAMETVHERPQEGVDDGERRSGSSLEASVDENDDRFFHEYLVSFGAPMKDDPFDMHAYMDAEFSQNLIEVNEVDDASVSSQNSLTFRGSVAKDSPKEFHYPEVGYRYYGVIKGSQSIPGYRATSQKTSYNMSLNIHPGGDNPGKYLSNTKFTKSPLIPSQTRSAVKKPIKIKKPFSDLLPPSPVNETRNLSSDGRYLVYLCDPQHLCGGWGDRQRGIVSTYLLSRLTNRQLKVVMTTPCSLRLFYKPNKVQWLPRVNELVTNANITINALLDKNFQFNIMDGDFNVKYPQKVIYLKTNQDYFSRLTKNSVYSSVLDQWGGLYKRRSRFHWAWSDLMQPSHMLLTHLQYILGTQFLIRKGLISNPVKIKTANSTFAIGNSTLICAHVRMGKNPTIPMDENLQAFSIEHLPTLLKFMSSKDTQGNAKFFVATDYEHIRAESKQYFGKRLLDYGGKILHIDRQRSEHSACVGFEVALIDQFILSLCDILIVCKSGFSINASYMSNSTGHVYYMKDGKIEQIND